MRPRSIAVVLHDLSLGGTERIALRLARAWCEAGVAATVICGDLRGPLRTLVPAGARLVGLDPPVPRSARRSRRARARLASGVARLLADKPVDVVFVIGNYHWDIIPSIAAIPAGNRPAIAVQISSPITKPQRGWLAQSLFDRRMKRLLAGADALIALDDHAAREAERIIGRGIVNVIPTPAIDDDHRPPVTAPDTPVVLAAGRMVPQKDFDTLLAGFASVRNPDARLVIAGSGPGEAALRAAASRAGLDRRVSFAGYVDDIRPLLDAARLFVLSSAYEGYPAVLVEALAAGRPVVATDCAPAVATLLRGREWGTIVPIGKPKALAIAIERALDALPASPLLLSATVEHHRLAPAAAAYLDLFGRLLARP